MGAPHCRAGHSCRPGNCRVHACRRLPFPSHFGPDDRAPRDGDILRPAGKLGVPLRHRDPPSHVGALLLRRPEAAAHAAAAAAFHHGGKGTSALPLLPAGELRALHSRAMALCRIRGPVSRAYRLRGNHFVPSAPASAVTRGPAGSCAHEGRQPLPPPRCAGSGRNGFWDRAAHWHAGTAPAHDHSLL